MKQQIQRMTLFSLCLGLLWCLGVAPVMAKIDHLAQAPLFEPAKLTDVTRWGRDALQKIYTYDFANYRHQFEWAAVYFTEKGWHSYLKAFKQSDNLRTVTKNNLVVNASITRRPTVLKQGIKDGVYFWHLQYGVVTRYIGANDTIKVPLLITLHIHRTKKQGYKGLGIQAFIAEENTGKN